MEDEGVGVGAGREALDDESLSEDVDVRWVAVFEEALEEGVDTDCFAAGAATVYETKSTAHIKLEVETFIIIIASRNFVAIEIDVQEQKWPSPTYQIFARKELLELINAIHGGAYKSD